MWVLWKDTKNVSFLLNCYSDKLVTLVQKQKDSTKFDITQKTLPTKNTYMNGVNCYDQMVTLYEHGRKSDKWWKKIFLKISYDFCCECMDYVMWNIPLFPFMILLTE